MSNRESSREPTAMVTSYDALAVGDELPPLTKGPIERIQLVKYAGASGDFNPIHVDEPFAKSAGYPSVFAHGMLSMGFLGELLTSWADPRQLRDLGVRFTALTWPGDTIRARARVARKYQEAGERRIELEVWTENQDGKHTLDGSAVIAFP
ncbi:MAG: MaoC family dehydratase [bacterium]